MEQGRDRLVEMLVELMERMSFQMRPRSPAEWSDLELTMPQARTMFLLHRQGPTRMGGLSEYLGRGLPSVTSMVDRLVRKGLVERVEDLSDRRVVACRLTAEGKDAVERFWQVSRVRRQALADALTLEELESAVPALEALTNAAARLEADPPMADEATSAATAPPGPAEKARA